MPGLLEHVHEDQLFQDHVAGTSRSCDHPCPCSSLLVCFPFASTRWGRRWGWWRNARGKSSTSFTEGDDGQVATCQLDVVEALSSIKIGCKGTVVLLSLLLWVFRRNFITIVGCIIVKPSGVLLVVPVVRGRFIVGRWVIVLRVVLVVLIVGGVAIIIVVVGLIPLTWIIGFILIEGCIATTFSPVASFGVSSHSLEVLAQHQEERLLDLALLQARGLCQHQLTLLARQASTSEEVPPLDLVWQRHLVVSQPVVELVMQGAIVQQRLTTVSLEATEVLVEVARELNSVVILKGLVQQLQQTAEGIALFNILQRECLNNFPGCSTEAGDQVEDTFRLPLQQLHLGHIEVDPLPPFAVVTGCTAEQRHVVVLVHGVVTNGACSWWHSTGCSSPTTRRKSPAQGEAPEGPAQDPAQQWGLLRAENSKGACSGPKSGVEACTGPRTAERPAQGQSPRRQSPARACSGPDLQRGLRRAKQQSEAWAQRLRCQCEERGVASPRSPVPPGSVSCSDLLREDRNAVAPSSA